MLTIVFCKLIKFLKRISNARQKVFKNKLKSKKKEKKKEKRNTALRAKLV